MKNRKGEDDNVDIDIDKQQDELLKAGPSSLTSTGSGQGHINLFEDLEKVSTKIVY